MRVSNIDHIIIIHCEQLTDRFKYLDEKLKSIGFQSDYYDFLVNTHKDTMTKEVVESYYTTDPNIRLKELQLIGEDKFLLKFINDGNVSCGINHVLAWKEIAKHSEWNNVLVLEDDTIITDTSLGNLCDVAQNLPNIESDFDIISLEDGAGMTVPNRYPQISINPDVPFYKSPDGRMRCTGAYIINKNACQKLVKLNKMRKFSLEIDMQLWLYGKLGLLNIYWAEPCVFTQGSQKGVYKSAIQGTTLSDKFKTNYMRIYETTAEMLSALYKQMEYGNKKCVDITKGTCEMNKRCMQSLLEDHDFSALSIFPKAYESQMKANFYPIKFSNNESDSLTSEICSSIKSDYFDGEIDVLVCQMKSSSVLVQDLLVDSVLINPKVVILTKQDEQDLAECINKRYKFLCESTESVVYVRKNIKTDEWTF